MDNVIVLNNEEYMICKELMMDNKHYIFAVSVENDKFTVLEQRETENGPVVKSLDSKEEVEKVINEIAKENN